MASSEGFLTDEQREQLKIASLNADIFSSSPKSPPSLLSEHHVKAPGGGKAPTVPVRHVRRSHSGKYVRVKKGESRTFFCILSLCLLSCLCVFDGLEMCSVVYS